MPGETLNQPKKVSRSLGIALGVTEAIYLLGLIALASGISLKFGSAWALIVVGAVLLATAFYNDRAMQKKGNE